MSDRSFEHTFEHRFEHIEELFHAARQLDADERTAFLDRHCHGDEELRSEVESLLAVEPMGATDLRHHIGSSFDGILLEPGTEVGTYTIVELLGEGGMGEVYRAEQTTPLQREVALKVVKAGMDTRQVLRRFELERQTLALLSHPGVASVFDAGVTDSGRPYFVMELVAGEPITTYCDRRRLTLTQRLELFVDVCAAVQHAHQRAVIHRDLKPSNLLIEEHGEKAQIKIIDFGIAKATTPQLTSETAATAIGQAVGTPEYMSPEQAGLSPVVDTRTDVYSLGVVLYELLAGAHPFDVERLRHASADEVRGYLLATEPERPSRKMSSTGHSASEIAGQRSSDPSALRRALIGDLDWIIGRGSSETPTGATARRMSSQPTSAVTCVTSRCTRGLPVAPTGCANSCSVTAGRWSPPQPSSPVFSPRSSASRVRWFALARRNPTHSGRPPSPKR